VAVPKYMSLPLLGKGARRLQTAISKKKHPLRSGILKFACGGKRRQFPWREPGRTPYEVLIAEVLLKRTTSTAAARVYNDFLRKFPNPFLLSEASPEEISGMFAKIGLQRQRATAAKKLAAHLVGVERGKVPSDLDRLLRIPGVGQYTARAVLSVGLRSPAAVVDSNVERIIHRVFMTSIPTRARLTLLQGIADTLLPQDCHREFNLGMLDLGSLVCRPSLPRCPECPLTNICDYYTTRGRKYPKKALQQTAKLGIRLRSIRKRKGISLVRLARDSKVSKLTIIRIEKGKSIPLPRTVKKLEHGLGEPLVPESSRGIVTKSSYASIRRSEGTPFLAIKERY